MDDLILQAQKYQAQLDEWKADVAKLKAQVAGAKADIQIEIHNDVSAIERNIDSLQAKISSVATASEDGFESVKKDLDSAWGSLKSALHDVGAKIKG